MPGSIKYLFLLLATQSFFLFSTGQVGYDTMYSRMYGNPNIYNGGLGLVELPGNNFLFSTGYNLGGGGLYCDWRPSLYKVNSMGDSTWSKLGIAGNGPVIKTSDQKFLCANTVHHPSNCGKDTIRVCKFDINGDTIWTKKFFFGLYNNQPKDVIQTSDGGYAVTGFYGTMPGGVGFVAFLIKLDASGNTQWIKHYGQPNDVDQVEALSVKQTSTGEFAIYCFRPPSSLSNKSIYRLIKTNSTGDTLWTRDLAGAHPAAGYGNLELLPGDNFLVVGSSAQLGVTYDPFLARFDKNGNQVFFKLYSPSSGNAFVINNVRYIPDHNAYLLVNNQFTLVDTTGNILWSSKVYDDVNFQDVIQTNDRGFAAIGYAYFPYFSRTIFIRFKDTTALPPITANDPKKVKVYPNPVTNNLVIGFDKKYSAITVQLVNVMGQVVSTAKFNDKDQLELLLGHLPSATYFLRIRFDEEQFSTGIIKLR